MPVDFEAVICVKWYPFATLASGDSASVVLVTIQISLFLGRSWFEITFQQYVLLFSTVGKVGNINAESDLQIFFEFSVFLNNTSFFPPLLNSSTPIPTYVQTTIGVPYGRDFFYILWGHETDRTAVKRNVLRLPNLTYNSYNWAKVIHDDKIR